MRGDGRAEPDRRSSRVWKYATPAGLAVAVLTLLLHARAYDFVADDTFITLRYARNLLEGNGLTYNPGDRVEGYTAP